MTQFEQVPVCRLPALREPCVVVAGVAEPSRGLLAYDPIRGFADQLKADGRATKTIAAYVRDLRMLARALQDVVGGGTLLTVDHAGLVAALTSPVIQQKSNEQARAMGSIERLKAASRSFFVWAVEAGLRWDNPAKRVKLRRVNRKVPEYLSQTNKAALLQVVRVRPGFAALRDRTMLEIFLGTGLRLNELIHLDLADVDLDNKRLRIVGKGQVPQVKFLKADLCVLLAQYLCRRADQPARTDDALFLSNRKKRISAAQVDNRVRYWVAEAGIRQKVTPHTLRHTFATHLYQRTGDVLMVQKALGHADLATTLIYTHLENKALADALEQL